ncbi:histidine phosphatase family protein [Candidatus Daviesbacteria bacterium]|nr:histidine phosphatase family protein [Candidatus Daviesbacteria bacterium]
MEIYVIRHGLTELNKKKVLNGQIDEPLAKEGIKQAEKALALIPETIQYIYSSPMMRAKQTAEIIASKLKRPVYLKKQLTEIHMGSIAGKSWDSFEGGLDLKKKHRSIQFDYRPLGGESVEQVKKRLILFLKQINNKYKDLEILLVTHGGIIRLLYLLEQNRVVDETEKHVSLLTFDLNKILKNS